MKGNFGAKGQPPRAIREITDEGIQDLAKSPITEEDALRSLGLKDHQIENVKKMFRWRLNWEIGKAVWRKEYNEDLAKSKDSSIQKMIAEHTLPPPSDIGDLVIIEIDAPAYLTRNKKLSANCKVKGK